MKNCKRCGDAKEKSLDFFYAHPQSKDGFHSWCKSCCKQWRDENREKRIAQMKDWVAKNSDYVKEQQSKHYQENKEHRIETTRKRAKMLANCPIEKARKSAYGKKWRVENPDKNRAKSNKRRATKEQRTPSWYNEFDDFVMQEAHNLALLRNKSTCFTWHVDHIIPLFGKVVSGLHVANNIDVVPQSYNNAKSNKFDVAVGAQTFIG